MPSLRRATQAASCNVGYICPLIFVQYLASLGIQSLVQQRAFAGKTANKLMDALKDSDLLHWKHSLSELIDISIAQKTAIWRLYGRRWVCRQPVKAMGHGPSRDYQRLADWLHERPNRQVSSPLMEVVCAGD